ncbi:MAG: radical SAM protein [Methanotrichaceae archaeon]|nr:radical SAM protein [Methanotrichaceae archaeon]
MDLETKARLLSVGTVELSEPAALGQSSTAGPGAGGQSIFFRSGEKTVRLSVVERSQLRLERHGESVAIMQGENEVVRGRLVEPLFHCPDQAYITVSERCIYDCKFCAVPKLQGGTKSSKRVREMVKQAAASGRLKAISLTSGVEVSPLHEAERVAGIVRDLKSFGVPIGVSVSPFPGVNRILKDAGADEVKYNLETLDPDLFTKVCPGQSMEVIKEALTEAVWIFGRNRVFSNAIVGLGESDKILRSGIDELADMGVLPVLRAVYPHPLRVGEIEMNRPSAERLLSLARYARRAMDRNGLRGDLALTGCYLCTGCDLVPGRDL